jgi:multiple sugar transport system permease protein
MVAVAEAPRRRIPRFSFVLDRTEILGPLFVAPAILYVLALVGLPFFLAVYYAVSA